MADEARELHPSDLAKLGDYVVARLSGSILTPPPSPPSGSITGTDLKSIQAISPDVGALERLVAMLVDRRMIDLRTEAQILKLVDDRMRRVNIKTDDEHYEETAEDMREVRKWTKHVRRVTAGLALAILSAMGAALFKLIGLNVPFPSIEPH